jgi:hypothetical protein
MKLYVWVDPYHVSYGGACLYVLAPGLDAAQNAALTALDAKYGHIHPADKPIKLEDLGEPTRVVSGPYAEVYNWSE